MQKFYASKTDTFTSPNGAIGYRSGSPMDCLGPYAKVQNCPIDGTDLRLTAYATGYADTAFSIPACTRYRGQYVGGYFTSDEQGVKFMPYDRFKSRLVVPAKKPVAEKAFFFVEITDTFGGDTNYTWVKRYKVRADTARGAITKVNREAGPYRIKKVIDCGDFVRHDAVGACICFLTSEWSEGCEHYTVKTI